MSQIPRPPNRIRPASRLKFFKYGLPFMMLTIGGSFALREFGQVRYDYSRKTASIPDKMHDVGIEMKATGEVTLDTEYDKLQKLNIDDWEQKRGPRPWEEAKST